MLQLWLQGAATLLCKCLEKHCTSRENKKPNVCAYSQPKKWDAQPTIVKEYYLYPDYKITEAEAKSLKIHEIQQLKKDRHAEINKAIKMTRHPNSRLNSDSLSPFLLMRLMKRFTQQA